MWFTDAGDEIAAPTLPRPEVVESLRHCEALGIDPDNIPPYIGELDRGGPVSQAAGPILDELCELLQGVRVAVVLTDAEVQVLETRFLDRELSDIFEKRQGTAGYSWAEEHVGTTAIALAAKNRKPTMVRGSEHYRPTDQDITAAAAPILDPFTEAVVGALDLSGPVSDASVHMFAAVVQAARSIRQRLYDQAGVPAHRLLSRFEAERTRASQDAIFVVNERLILSNGPATALLHAVDRGTLWEQALDTVAAMRGMTTTNLLTLRDGRSLTAHFEKTDPSSVRAGVLVRVAPDERGPAVAPPSRRPVPHRGEPRPLEHFLDQEITRAARQTGSVLVVGESGSGKLTVAEEIHRLSETRQLAIADGAKDLTGAGSDLLRDIAAMAAQPETTLILRHVECLGMPALTLLRELMLDGGPAARILATMSLDPRRPDRADVDDLFPNRIHVPALRDRLDELPELVTTLMRRHGATGQMQRAAIDALRRHEWPGNFRELNTTIKSVVSSRRTCDITARDLPPAFTAACPRKLTRMEHLERAAIRQALAEAGGNRTKAAAILQIGRATLYRKLKSFGLELELEEVA